MMVSVSEARRMILSRARLLSSEEVALADAAERVLAEDIVAVRALPPWDNAAMDGCACRGADLAVGEPLRLVGTIHAGGDHGFLGAGEAVKIMTGARIPEGADTVVPVEDLRIEDGRVHVLRRPPTGAHVRPAGEDVACGELVLPAGTLVRPAEVGMLASLGRPTVRVFRKPSVAVLSTGDELVDPSAPGDDPRIRDANGYALQAQVLQAGGDPVRLGITPDVPGALAEAVARGLEFDVLVSSGGVSAGDSDFLPAVLKGAGVTVHFHKVAIKPGKPALFGTAGQTLVFALPGNPVACFVGFEQFVRPALRRMQGRKDRMRPVVNAVLDAKAGPVRHKPGRTEFLRCRVVRDPEGLRVVEIQRAGSGLLSTLVRANGFLVLEADATGAHPGDAVAVQLYDDAFPDQNGEPALDAGSPARPRLPGETHARP